MNVYGIIGDPVGHSLSPDIYNFLFKTHGLDAVYLPLRIPADRPELIGEAVDMLGLSGFNVTMPHKQTILPMLSGMTAAAERIRSVNTVGIKDGRMTGETTDGRGFSRGLQPLGGMAGRSVLILGAGGAARAVAFQAADDGARHVEILSRRPEQAAALAGALQAEGASVSWGIFSPEAVAKSRAELLINATPLGMHGCPEAFGSFAFLQRMEALETVCDLIYNPSETELLRCASAAGKQTQNGLPMLLWQALCAFEFWTGIRMGPGDYDRLQAHLSKF
ncbi:shikimate dehydrogenase [Oscillospiraceae bacterium OttesenSCG-928-F05]|nr:shikimate dehydrogenase [Oscillospiraceae bacterium OttesenSCG-928-F05]